MKRILTTSIAAAAALSLASPALASSNLASTGQAYGTSVSSNSVVGSGKTAPVYMCTVKNRASNRNFVATTGPELPLKVSGVENRTRRLKIDGRPASIATSTLAEVRLGSDLVLKAVRSKSQVVSLGGGQFDRSFETSVGSLSIAGELITLEDLNQPQRFDVPGVGVLVLNTGREFDVPGGAGVRAIAARLRLADPDQTVVRLAKSSATLVPNRRSVVSGGAHALDASLLNGLVGVGKVARQPLPCFGTGGVVKENETASLNLPGVLTVDGAYARSFSDQTRDEVVARTEGGLARLVLGDGQVVVDTVRSVAQVGRGRDGSRIFSTAGSLIGSLTVNGELQEIPQDGETMEIPGMGRLEFGVIEEKLTGFTRTAIVAVLLDEAGAEVRIPIGVASAYVR